MSPKAQTRKKPKTPKAPSARDAAARSGSRKRRQKRRQSRRTLHHVLLVLFLLAAATVMCLTVLFKIEAVTVTGSDRYTEEELVAASGILVGDNLFRVPAEQIEAELLKEFPYLERVRIRRLFPPSIEIQVEQSVPAVAATDGDVYVLVTRAGKVLERGLLLLTDDVLLVKGLEISTRGPGDMLGTFETELRPSRDETPPEAKERAARNVAAEERAAQEEEAMKMIGYLFDAMDKTGFRNLTNLDITNRLNMQVMYDNRLLLKLGSEANLEDKLLFISVVVRDRLHPQARGTLNAADVSTKDQVVYTPESGYNSDGSPIEHIVPQEDAGEKNGALP